MEEHALNTYRRNPRAARVKPDLSDASLAEVNVRPHDGTQADRRRYVRDRVIGRNRDRSVARQDLASTGMNPASARKLSNSMYKPFGQATASDSPIHSMLMQDARRRRSR